VLILTFFAAFPNADWTHKSSKPTSLDLDENRNLSIANMAIITFGNSSQVFLAAFLIYAIFQRTSWDTGQLCGLRIRPVLLLIFLSISGHSIGLGIFLWAFKKFVKGRCYATWAWKTEEIWAGLCIVTIGILGIMIFLFLSLFVWKRTKANNAKSTDRIVLVFVLLVPLLVTNLVVILTHLSIIPISSTLVKFMSSICEPNDSLFSGDLRPWG